MSKRVVVTRPSGPYAGGQRFIRKLQERGFEPFELAVLRCVPIALTENLKDIVQRCADGELGIWLAFLSPTAVFVWRDLSQNEPVLKRCLKRAFVAAQGAGTADACLECFGRGPDFVPSVFVAEEFAKELARVLKPGQHVLVPQSAEGRDLLAQTLAQCGFLSSSFPTYRLEPTRPSEETMSQYRALADEETSVVFMSPSAVRATVELVGESLSGKRLISVGPITSQAIRKAGFSVWREAVEHSEEGVLDLLGRYSAAKMA